MSIDFPASVRRISILSSIVLAGCGAGKIALSGGDTSEAHTSTDASGSTNDDNAVAEDDSTDDSNGSTVFGEDIVDSFTCDPFNEHGCPDGEKCAPLASQEGTWNYNDCVPVNGSKAAGEPCIHDGWTLGTDDCDAETICWNAIDVDGQRVGTCSPLCSGTLEDPTCDDPLTSCRLANWNTISVCLPACDPLLQDCEAGLGCYWSEDSGDFHCVTVAGEITTGEPCGFNNDCQPGNICVDAAAVDGCQGSQCCAYFCELGLDPGLCAPGHECVPLFADGTAPAKHVDVGLCIIAPGQPLSLPDTQ